MTSSLPLLLCATVARAGDPTGVSLPPGDDAATWSAPLRLAGLHVAGPGEADIEIRAVDGAFEVHVRGARSVSVPLRDAVLSREDAAWLAASLAEERASLPVPPALPARPRPARPPVAPVAPVVEVPTVGDVPPVGEAPPPPVAETPPIVVVVPFDPPPPRSAVVRIAPGAAAIPFVGVVPSVTARAGMAPGWGVAVRGGADIARGPVVAVQAAWIPGREIADLDASARVSVVDLDLVAGVLDARGTWLAGTGGVSSRTWTQDGDRVARTVQPVVGVEVGRAWTLASGFVVLPMVGARADLGTTRLQVEPHPPETLSPLEILVGASLSRSTKKSPE